MAENVTIARPYADAAFELARGQVRWGLGRKRWIGLPSWRPIPA